MEDHDCAYARLIGRQTVWQVSDGEPTVCMWCHIPKTPPAKVSVDKTRKA